MKAPRKHDVRSGLSERRQYRPSPVRAVEQEQSPEDIQEAMLERREKNARRRRDSSSYRQTQQKQQKQRQVRQLVRLLCSARVSTRQFV